MDKWLPCSTGIGLDEGLKEFTLRTLGDSNSLIFYRYQHLQKFFRASVVIIIIVGIIITVIVIVIIIIIVIIVIVIVITIVVIVCIGIIVVHIIVINSRICIGGNFFGHFSDKNDFPFRREFDGITQQINYYLPQPISTNKEEEQHIK